MLELVHPATTNTMRMHWHSKLFDHNFILNGGYKISAVQKLPFFFIEELIVLSEINYDSHNIFFSSRNSVFLWLVGILLTHIEHLSSKDK